MVTDIRPIGLSPRGSEILVFEDVKPLTITRFTVFCLVCRGRSKKGSTLNDKTYVCKNVLEGTFYKC